MTENALKYCLGIGMFFMLQSGMLFAQTSQGTPSKIDYETIAAYERIGLTYVGWVKDHSNYVSFGGEHGFPAFRVRPTPLGGDEFATSKLPEVSVPFAMCLPVSSANLRKGIKELSGLKNLVGLALEGVSDAELKEVLDVLPQLAYIGLYKTSLTEVGIADLSRRKNIVSISFTPSDITDDFLRMLSRHGLVYRLSRAQGKNEMRPTSLEEVISLDLNDTKVTNAGLKELPFMKNLAKFSGTLSADGLKDVTFLKNITTLDVGKHGAVFSDHCLKEIAGNSKVASLNLSNTNVTDAGLASLATMPSLAVINLAFTGVTDNGLKEFHAAKNLAVLNLNHTEISDKGLEELRGHMNITELTLYHTQVTSAGLKQLAGLKKLTKLYVNNVSDGGLKELAAVNNLTELGLTAFGGSGSPVTNGGLKYLAVHKNLATLDLTNSGITADGLKELVGLKKLEELRLSDLEDAHLRELNRLGMLHVLSLAGAKGNARPKSVQEIVSLALQETEVTDRGLEEIGGLTNLVSFNLRNTKVTDKGLRHLARMKQLMSLDLAHTNVTDAGLKELYGLANLRRLDLSNTESDKCRLHCVSQGVAQMQRL